jgi:flavoprotein hydroxylase
MFCQPQLEQLLDRTAKSVPSVDVQQGMEVRDVTDKGDHVILVLGAGESVDGRREPTGRERETTARYVIGCDGANSIVRERIGTPVEDLGFAFDWLIADTLPSDPTLLAGVNLQRCDPERPTTLVSGGPGRRRWEWMLLPGESRKQVENVAYVWELLAQSGVGESDVSLERYAVYTFRACWAERWRRGRMLIAGDAAHLMPPFAGQGMCAGVRDALTLSWHLDLVLKGQAHESTLDAYTSERRGHVQQAIATSVELGKVICIADPAEAAARDATLLALAGDPDAPAVELPEPALGPGIRDDACDDEASRAPGLLFPQGRVRLDGETRLLEDTIDRGFVLYALGLDPGALLDDDARLYLDTLDCALVELGADQDRQHLYRDWFSQHGCSAALVRPDFYVFGAADATVADTSALVRRLRDALADPYEGEEKSTP